MGGWVNEKWDVICLQIPNRKGAEDTKPKIHQ